MQAGAVYRFTLYAGENQALSRKSAFKLNKHNKNTNKWRHNKEGGRPHRHVARCYVAGQSAGGGEEGIVYDADDDSSHNFTGRQSESLCEWNEWIPAAAGWRRMWVPVRVLSRLSTSGRYSPSPPHQTPSCEYLTSDMKEKAQDEADCDWDCVFILSFSPSLLPLDRNTERVACVVAFLYTVYEREGERERGAASRRGRVS